jgi:hypothetical protein
MTGIDAEEMNANKGLVASSLVECRSVSKRKVYSLFNLFEKPRLLVCV